MTRKFYSIVFYLALPIILLYLVIHTRKSTGYGERWRELFGYYPTTIKPSDIWLHAVSLGESILAKPLLQQLQERYPDKLITVTTMTPTGAEYIKKNFTDNVQHVYVPLDFNAAIKRFLQIIQPRIAIFMETELWPNKLALCKEQNIPLIIANGRLSERSLQTYSKVSQLTQSMLANVTTIAAQSQDDAQRFQTLGAGADKINIVGNIKFDIQVPEHIPSAGTELRKLWQADRPVWIAASTHQGEDEQILNAHHIIKKTYPNSVLILVPRHPERFVDATTLSNNENFHTVLRTEEAFCSEYMDVFIGNTIGELLVFYAASDVAFVGGSLIERGGHNPLEPAALAKPVITGPHIFNFDEIYRLLTEQHGVFHINNAETLADCVVQLFTDQELQQKTGQNALTVVNNNRGAIDNHMKIFEKYIL